MGLSFGTHNIKKGSGDTSYLDGIKQILLMKLKQGLEEESKDKDEERELRKKIKTSTTLAEQGYYDDLVGRDEALKLAASGIDPQQMQEISLSKKIGQLESDKAERTRVKEYLAAEADAKSKGIIMSPPEDIKRIFDKHSVTTPSDLKNFQEYYFKEKTSGELGELIKRRRQLRADEKGAKAEDIQDKLLDIQEKAAGNTAKLNELTIKDAELNFDIKNAPTDEEKTASEEYLLKNGKARQGVGSEKYETGISNIFRPGRLLDAARDFQELSENDKILGGRAIRAKQLGRHIKTLLPQDRQIRDNEVEIIRRINNLTREEVLKILGISEQQVDKSQEGFKERFEARDAFFK